MRGTAIALLLGAGLYAGPGASVTGRISDPSGAPMPAVNVQAVNVETGVKSVVTTGDEGLFSIPYLAPGNYRVIVQRHGFRTIVKLGVDLKVQDVVALNFEMQIGSVDQSITVAEGVPLVQSENAMVGQTIDQNVMAALPTLTRNPYDFVSLSAGAARAQNILLGNCIGCGERGAGISINGQRPESANFQLDGSDNNNALYGSLGNGVPHEAVREYRVITNSYTAEYGRSAGFVANLVTKSGTNEYHGSLYDYMRNSALAANTFGNNANRFARPVFNRHQAGGSIGAPVRRDRAFVFASLEALFVRSYDTNTYTVPTPQLLNIASPGTRLIFQKYPLPANLSATDVLMRTVRPFGGAGTVTIPAFARTSRTGPDDAGAGNPQNTLAGTARFDGILNARTTVMARYAITDTDQFAVVRQPYSRELDQPRLTRNQNATLAVTRVWRPGLVGESRAVFNRFNTTAPATGPPYQTLDILTQPETMPTGRIEIGGPSNLYQTHHNLTWVTGRHQFKFGGQIVHQRDASRSVAMAGNQMTFSSLQSFIDGAVSSLSLQIDLLANGLLAPGSILRAPVIPPARIGHMRFTDYAWFAQDTWRVSPRLTLTPGIRFEYSGDFGYPGHERGHLVNFYLGEGASYHERFANGRYRRTVDAPEPYRGHTSLPDRNNFAPRLGVAYLLTKDARTVIRAGGGIYFDTPYGRNKEPFETRVNFGPTTLTPNTPILDDPFAITRTYAGAIPTTIGYVRWDQDMTTPYSGAWNATLERELRSNVVAVSYIGSAASGLYALLRDNLDGSGRYVGRPTQRLIPGYASFFAIRQLAHSSYHSLQLRAERRMSRRSGLQYGANYTWGHSIDNASSWANTPLGYGTFLVNPEKPRLDRASSAFDQRHRFVTHFVWQPPALRRGHLLVRTLLSNWQASGIVSLQTGHPFDVHDLGIPGTFARPRLTGPAPQPVRPDQMRADPQTPNRFLYMPTNALRAGACIPTAAPLACYNSIWDPMDDAISRNAHTRPGDYAQDIAISRVLRINERTRIRLRGEFYNLFNHASLTLGNFNLNEPSFAGGTVYGLTARYAGTPRQIVLALRLEY